MPDFDTGVADAVNQSSNQTLNFHINGASPRWAAIGAVFNTTCGGSITLPTVRVANAADNYPSSNYQVTILLNAPAAGEISIVVLFMMQGTAPVSDPIFTLPAGWTLIGKLAEWLPGAPFTDSQMWLFTTTNAGSQTVSWTPGYGGAAIVQAVVTGVTAIDVLGGSNGGPSVDPLTTGAGVTSTGSPGMALAAFGAADTAPAPSLFNSPTGGFSAGTIPIYSASAVGLLELFILPLSGPTTVACQVNFLPNTTGWDGWNGCMITLK